MKSFAVLAICLSLLAACVFADCPAVYNYDDPPCTPCPYEPDGSPLFREAIWQDGSTTIWYVQNYRNCDNDTYQQVVPNSVYFGCPSGPSQPCMARDSGWLP